MLKKKLKNIIIVFSLIAFTNFLTFKITPYLSRHKEVMAFIDLQKSAECELEKDKYAGIANNDERVHIIVGIPENLASGEDEKDCDWAKTFLAQKNDSSWVCIKKGNGFKHRGYIFKLSKTSKEPSP